MWYSLYGMVEHTVNKLDLWCTLGYHLQPFFIPPKSGLPVATFYILYGSKFSTNAASVAVCNVLTYKTYGWLLGHIRRTYEFSFREIFSSCYLVHKSLKSNRNKIRILKGFAKKKCLLHFHITVISKRLNSEYLFIAVSLAWSAWGVGSELLLQLYVLWFPFALYII